MKPKRVLIFCPLHEGGIAEHAHYQANALARMGIDTVMLASPGFLPDHARKRYRILPWLLPIYSSSSNRTLKALYFAFSTIVNEAILMLRILLWGQRHVLLAASSETLALVWAWPHALLRLLGVHYAANIHDPQRKRLSGSSLVHRWSIRAGFLATRIGLIHEDFDADQPDIPRHVRCLRVPYGCYDADIQPGDGNGLRAELAGPGGGRTIFLAFGYIADRKNLDLCIRAVAQLPGAVLLAAGRVASRHDKSADYYRELAIELGCADRVRIVDGFIPEGDVRHYFGAADAILLTYKAEFVSQSGVLLLASNWAKPVLASSGPGPLTTTVAQFDLGPTVPPDDVEALRTAMQGLIEQGYSVAGWPAFRTHASWERNVAVLVEDWNANSKRGSR